MFMNNISRKDKICSQIHALKNLKTKLKCKQRYLMRQQFIKGPILRSITKKLGQFINTKKCLFYLKCNSLVYMMHHSVKNLQKGLINLSR